jgi:predicted regulator of Ras-like GTPase activity (Roadblock/LC7/MglB family)
VPFKNILRELVETTSGASGAILTDWEGEEVVHYCCSHTDEFDLKLIGAHKAIILSWIKETQQRLQHDGALEAVITTELQHFIVGAIGSDYTLILTLEKDAMLARARYCFQKSVKLLAKEIY